MLLCVCRSMDNFVQAYRDMSPARVAMANGIKRSFNQMAVVSFILTPEIDDSMKIRQIFSFKCLLGDLL